MKKIKLLFQGDSITDAGRNFEDYHDLGGGYPKYAAELIKNKYPDIDFEFIDLGIGGNQTKDLVNRLQRDFIEIQPDIVSILVGVNDVWHYKETGWLDNDVFENNYRTVLKEIKEKTNAKIFMIEPYVIPGTELDVFWENLPEKIWIIRKLAREFADVYMPLDGLFNSAFIGENPLSFAADGVHPTVEGAKFIAGNYVEYIAPLIDKLCEN